VGRLLEALDARGGLQNAASAELLHGFEPVMAALLQQARDLQLQLGIGFVEMDWQFVAHCSALRSLWAPFRGGCGPSLVMSLLKWFGFLGFSASCHRIAT